MDNGANWVEQTAPSILVFAAAVPVLAAWGLLLLVGALLLVGRSAAARQAH